MQPHSQEKSDNPPSSLRIRIHSTIQSVLKHFQPRQKAVKVSEDLIGYPVADTGDEASLRVDEAPLPVGKRSIKCVVCNDLDPRGHAETQNVSNNGNQVPTLRVGIGFPAKDCGYCDLLLRAIKEFFPFSSDVVLAILLAENHPISLWIPTIRNKDIRHCRWLDIYALRDIPVIPSIGKGVSISESSDSRGCFDFIQKCLLDCREHAECQISHSSALPRRLLYLEGPSNSFELQNHQTPKIKLCETNGQAHRYATLSHCRGSTYTIETTSTNVREFEDTIHWHLLPKAYQDAIITALRLDIQYLWIDSLCIIQDDKLDWDTEVVKTGAIFENSYLTIAATSSPSSASSFLGPRPPDFRPKALQFPNPQRLSKTINNTTVLGNSDDINALRVRQGQSIQSVNLSELFKPRIYGPLERRGWALQERLLSSRIVHFTDEGIVWECRQSIQSEDQRRLFPGPLQKWRDISEITGKNQLFNHVQTDTEKATTLTMHLFISHHGTVILSFRSSYIIPDKQMQHSELRGFWRELLMDYTKRRLTKREDILPALSGIAARMQSFHNSHYCAGLWYDRFIEDLCWRPLAIGGEYKPSIPSPSDSVPDEDIDLPSWSWISIQRSISFAVIDELGTFTPYSKIMSCDCIPADPNPFGRVLSGCAIIEGRLLEASISYNGVQATFTDPLLSSDLIELQAPLLANSLTNNGQLVNTVRRARQGEELKRLKGTVWCLYLGHWRPGKQMLTIGGLLEHDFLLVLGRSARVAGAYERIGNVYSLVTEAMLKRARETPVQRVSIV